MVCEPYTQEKVYLPEKCQNVKTIWVGNLKMKRCKDTKCTTLKKSWRK